LDVVRRENTQTLADLIASIDAMSPRRFLLGMLENVFSDPDPATGAAYTEETVPASMEAIRQKISGSAAQNFQNPIDEEDIDLFLDACMNPVDTQERLVRLLRKYEGLYRENGADFEANSLETHRRFSEKWGAAPTRFLDEILSLKEDFFVSDQTIYLAPSSYLDICYITFIYSGQFGVHDCFVVYGTGVEQRNWFKERKTRRKLLFKILSEDNRFEIIKRLARRDFYLFELANDLGLTSATTSHHISMLFELGIIEMKRDGNKTVFTLKKDLLKSLFAEAIQEILPQENLQ
jgi:DNA-binding transcriptional ArsR family regulator